MYFISQFKFKFYSLTYLKSFDYLCSSYTCELQTITFINECITYMYPIGNSYFRQIINFLTIHNKIIDK